MFLNLGILHSAVVGAGRLVSPDQRLVPWESLEVLENGIGLQVGSPEEGGPARACAPVCGGPLGENDARLARSNLQSLVVSLEGVVMFARKGAHCVTIVVDGRSTARLRCWAHSDCTARQAE
jgi:hypothetical protein